MGNGLKLISPHRVMSIPEIKYCWFFKTWDRNFLAKKSSDYGILEYISESKILVSWYFGGGKLWISYEYFKVSNSWFLAGIPTTKIVKTQNIFKELSGLFKNTFIRTYQEEFLGIFGRDFLGKISSL